MYSIQVWGKRERSFTHTVASGLWGLLVPGHISKDGKKMTGYQDHFGHVRSQSVQASVCDHANKRLFFKECLCFRRYVCIKVVGKTYCRTTPPFRHRTNVKLSKKYGTDNQSIPNAAIPVHCFVFLFKKKYLQKLYKRLCEFNELASSLHVPNAGFTVLAPLHICL